MRYVVQSSAQPAQMVYDPKSSSTEFTILTFPPHRSQQASGFVFRPVGSVVIRVSPSYRSAAAVDMNVDRSRPFVRDQCPGKIEFAMSCCMTQ